MRGRRLCCCAVPQSRLDATVAQKFFETAEKTKAGLGGGYTAFGDEQIFLNVADSEGKPYSGLNDAAFLAGLKETVTAFGEPKPEIAESGKATARFIENDWAKSKGGEEYLQHLGGSGSALSKRLTEIENDYATLVEKTAKSRGWK